MHVINTLDNKQYEVVIKQVAKPEIKLIGESRRFKFNWKKPGGGETYKLALKQTGEVLGMMSVTNRPDDYAVEVNLLEAAIGYWGPGKLYDRIAGCMIAYACRLAFYYGYDGYICLTPKTIIRPHYINEYGMTDTGLYLVLEREGSNALIRQYLET